MAFQRPKETPFSRAFPNNDTELSCILQNELVVRLRSESRIKVPCNVERRVIMRKKFGVERINLLWTQAYCVQAPKVELGLEPLRVVMDSAQI